jgi:hypothetical protein
MSDTPHSPTELLNAIENEPDSALLPGRSPDGGARREGPHRKFVWAGRDHHGARKAKGQDVSRTESDLTRSRAEQAAHHIKIKRAVQAAWLRAELLDRPFSH